MWIDIFCEWVVLKAFFSHINECFFRVYKKGAPDKKIFFIFIFDLTIRANKYVFHVEQIVFGALFHVECFDVILKCFTWNIYFFLRELFYYNYE